MQSRMKFMTWCLLGMFSIAILQIGSSDALCTVGSGLPNGIGGGEVTVSGVSSGAAMAHQIHIAHSSWVRGAGMIAGVPYYCSKGSFDIGLDVCMKNPPETSADDAVAYLEKAVAQGLVDNPDNMKNDRVWVFASPKDVVVNQEAGRKIVDLYSRMVAAEGIASEFGVEAAHSMVTDRESAAACDTMVNPYINNCGYDAAGKILAHMYGSLNPRADPKTSDELFANIVEFDQQSFVPSSAGHPHAISMDTVGYAYVPSGCRGGAKQCRVHVAMHGCMQGADSVGLDFVRYAGYNEWAETNDIIIVYPQLVRVPFNEAECWDWYGLTGSRFATKEAPQIITIHNIVRHLSSVENICEPFEADMTLERLAIPLVFLLFSILFQTWRVVF